MIRVVKPVAPPAGLAGGVALTTINCADYNADAAAYRSGAKKFTFAKDIYGPFAVKAALNAVQHNKCCYCESVFSANYAGDVEHYRPKGAVTQIGGKILPGYYWLAYTWANLFYACAACNQYNKRDQFPLVDEVARARSHNDLITAEAPLILNPGGADDPRTHIVFKDDVPAWTSVYGKATIKILKLDREQLNLSRRSHLDRLDLLLAVLETMKGRADEKSMALAKRAWDALVAAQRSDAVFSAASQDFISRKNPDAPVFVA